MEESELVWVNFNKQFGIYDALDRLHAKYGDDWDVEADLNDPDIGRIKNLRNAIKLHEAQKQTLRKVRAYNGKRAVIMLDKVTNKTRVFETTKDVAELLSITTSRVSRAIRDQTMVKHRFKFKRQPQYLEDGGF